MELLGTEHYELMSSFEKEYKTHRVNHEKKAMWKLGHIYADGTTNMLFLAYRKGYSLRICIENLEGLATENKRLREFIEGEIESLKDCGFSVDDERFEQALKEVQ